MTNPIIREVTIGNCRLIQGDCLEVMPLLGKVDACVTDPPFGMDFRSNHRKVKHKVIENDGDAALLRWACELHASHSSYVFMRWNNIVDVPMPKSLITWVKNNHSMGDLEHEHGRKTEVCAFYKGTDHFFPSGRPNDVIYADRTGNALHPTQKPVHLMEVVVGWTSGVVVDPFMGSGTTGVACVNLGRSFIGIERDPEYFDICVERITKAHQQGDLFVEKPAPVEKEPEKGLFDI